MDLRAEQGAVSDSAKGAGLRAHFSAVGHQQRAICFLNPLVVAVQADEDYVGKISSISRQVGASQVIERVLERSLAASFKHWKRKGLIKL